MKLSLLIFPIASLFALSAHAQPKTIGNLNEQRKLVVKLKSQPLDRTSETSAGFLVGSDGNNAYFATALHPLRKRNGSDDDFDPVAKVSLWFLSSPVPVSATVLNEINATDDLAVVFVPVTNLPPSLGVLSIGEPSAELSVHIIGHPGAGDWSSWTGRVENEQVAGSDPHLFTTDTNASISNGYSGGPVLDSSGTLIGMHLSSEGSYTKNLKSSEIATWLKVWKIPMQGLSISSPENQHGATPEPKLSTELLSKSVRWGTQLNQQAFSKNFEAKIASPNFLWLDLPENILVHVRAAEYRMNHSTFGGSSRTTSDKSHHLLVKFNAWGCVNDSTVTIELDDGQLLSANFDECQAYRIYVPEQQ